MVKKDNSIIYVDSNKILFYAKNAASVLQLNISSDVVSDLEVVNKDKLNLLIDNFFQTPTLKGKEFESVLIFSPNTTFEKEVLDNNTKIQSQEIQKFLDMVPFEDIMSNTYRINKKTKVVAINKVLFSFIKLAFEKNKSHIFLVLPMNILVETNPELKNKIDLAFIEGKLESLKQYSIIDLNEIGLGGEVANSIGIKKKDRRLYVMLLVFFGLMLILLYLVYTTFIAASQNTKRTIVVPQTIVNEQEKVENPPATNSAQTATPSSLLTPTPLLNQ